VLVVCSTLLAGGIGMYWGLSHFALLGAAAIGVSAGLGLVWMCARWLHCSVHQVLGGAGGMMVGAVMAWVLFARVGTAVNSTPLILGLYWICLLLFVTVGMTVGAAKASDITREKPGSIPSPVHHAAVLDTSVIIDGRIADVCETGFMNRPLIIPQFVLREVQAIADAAESTKRARGRRGLDILNRLKKQAAVSITIDDSDFPTIREVDQKLIALAKQESSSILTNDYNLHKVAEVQGITVLNVNQLAAALKPSVLPGETMTVQVIKEGKEPGQGIAYLDDGTMVVVEHGRRFMGRTLEVTVSSVLQTTTGRMIFAGTKT
jgi:uncharacterized protein YacL